LTSDSASSPRGHGHEAVLLAEILDGLAPRAGESAIDLTVGRGGHAVAIADRLGPTGTLVAVDRDRGNLEHAGKRLAEAFRGDLPSIEKVETVDGARLGEAGPIGRGPRIVLLHGNFATVPQALLRCGLRTDLVLADLGVASTHLDEAERGFSFRFDGPLDMRLDRSRGPTAADLIASLPEAELAEAIRRLGEEPLARTIARKIARRRESTPITTTSQLVDLVRDAYGPRAHRSRMHPATKTFMALRIAVNDELGALAALLAEIRRSAEATTVEATRPKAWLARRARVGIVSFHSLEDRLVKRFFGDLQRDGLGRVATRRPIVASEEEQSRNPRSRSARLRIATVGDPTHDSPARTAAHDP